MASTMSLQQCMLRVGLSLRLHHCNVRVIQCAGFEPPVITGETTIVEGDDLLLQCNAPISIISPFLLWLDSAGQVITQTADLVITNFTRDMAGIYTCVATYTITTSFIINATASVMVQSEPNSVAILYS